MRTYLIPTVERPIWPGSPLSKIIDVLNYVCANYNGHNGGSEDNEDLWKRDVDAAIYMNNLREIGGEIDPEQKFGMGFGGNHFWVHNLHGERVYIIYARRCNF